ncbi:MAG: winged helix DNA-binding domain-containing protein [Gordonia sp. (in: high G+C Gram-positive bacteria)]|uniref:winged helix DNA-binding domain-containing protein n=1 Tax=Gordonia sp. (in: high G+C Gram-positive bacteria) TaxID=84139 RepID=UPI0039E3A3C4
MRHVGDDRRRARLLRRQFTDVADAGPESITRTAVGLHATTASTVHLSVRARNAALRPERVEQALYDDRTLIKQLCMRRTLFVLTRPLLAAAVGAVGERVGASERTNMLRLLRQDGSVADPERWIDDACAAVVDLLGGRELAAAQVRAELGDLDISVIVSPGKSYGGPSPMLPRILNHLSARGVIVRGHNEADWRRSRPLWTTMTSWLGEDLRAVDPGEGHRVLIEHWLRSYGPGTETDLVWWLGSTRAAVRTALTALGAVDVSLDSGDIGYLMPDDLDDVEPPEPRAALLPELDPATMGYKERGFYLGDHAPHLFDRNGNGGQTAWWDGRIVGGWHQDGDGRIVVVPLEDLPAGAGAALDACAGELAEWLGDDRPIAGYPSPLMKRHR